MKTLLSIVFAVSMCCLLTSKGMAAGEAKPALFTIISARYGAGDEWSDVSDKVKAAVQNDALTIEASNANFGDPISGTMKLLRVVIKYNGEEFAFQAGEGTTLTINKAALDAKVNEKAARGDPAKQILQLTGGARTKIVWSRGVDRPGGFSIMLLDTSEGRERVLAEQTHCRIPFITPSGNRVIVDDMYATSDQKRIYVMDMNGNKKELGPAHCAMGVAEDPPGTEWAYYADANHDANPRGKLWRVQIDNPTVKELVWDKSSIGWQWAFTRDGKTAAGGLPWPGAHIANLPNGSYQQVHDSGCMVALAPSGKRMLHCTALQFGGEHRGFGVHSAPNWSSCVLINLGDAPGVNNQTVLWPAWALYDERFFVITGPWTKGASPGNILFGQFNAEFNGIARWVQVTQCPEGVNDCNASCWIESGPDVKDAPKIDPIKTKAAEKRDPAPAAGGWPADR